MKTQVFTVTGTISQGREKPQILLTGAFLPDLGFGVRSLVTAKSAGDMITLLSCGTGIGAYKQAVGEVRANGHTLLSVTSLCKRPRIDLSGDWLYGCGFKTGDVVIAGFGEGMITVKRLDLKALGLDARGPLKTKVHKVRLGVERKRRVPYILFSGHWLSDIGFQTGQYAKVAYQNEMLTFETGQKAGDISGLRNTCHGWPQKVKIHDIPCYNGTSESFLLKGDWLLEEGFQAGDTLIILYEHERIRVKRLDINKYGV